MSFPALIQLTYTRMFNFPFILFCFVLSNHPHCTFSAACIITTYLP